ncbi:MAG: Hpt domain-containing protein [SAR324 cluster bacterium]|nr:Hpt domain-containing protein [SAR324 cluster bacterium]
MKRITLFMILLLCGFSVNAEPVQNPCSSCDFLIQSLDKPFSLVGTWLFTRDDNPQNKDLEADIKDWKIVKAPGPWKKVYDDGKSFRIGWYRGTLRFDPSLLGQEVVFLIDTYVARLDVFLDGQKIYHRGDINKYEPYYGIQPVPVRFKITETTHTLAFRVDTILMVGIYQLPFELRAYNPGDAFIGFFHFWGGEFRFLAAHLALGFGLFFLLVFYKTRYPMYLLAALSSIMVYPFYAFPGNFYMKWFDSQTLLVLHYIGITSLGIFPFYFAQYFYKEFPKNNIVHGVLNLLLLVIFSYLSIDFHLELFQKVRVILFLYEVSLIGVVIYMLSRTVFGKSSNKTKGLPLLLVAEIFFFFSCVHDILIALGKINSVAMIFSGTLFVVVAMLWVASNIFADTFVENKRLVKDLKTINEHLEEMVEQRTEQLRQKNNDIQSMLQNLPQGILTIAEENKIHPEYSIYLETIFETKQIAGQEIMSFLFDGSNLGVDAQGQINSTLESCIGEDEMNFDLNRGVLPLEYEKILHDGQVKTLSLIWSPICNDDEIIEKILVCVRDVTQLKQLEKEAGQQKKELEMIGEILAITNKNFVSYIKNSNQFLLENRKLIENTTQASDDVLQTLFRNMHTIKGNARVYGLHNMTDTAHHAEQSYDALRKKQIEWNQELLLRELNEVSYSLELYNQLYEEKLSVFSGKQQGTFVEETLMEKLKHTLQDSATDKLDTIRHSISQMKTIIMAFDTESLDKTVSEVIQSLPSIAKEIGKPTPTVLVKDQNVRIRSEIVPMLKDVFMHLFRNAIDHGIESREERVRSGKSDKGQITLEAAIVNGKLQLRLFDDGRGLGLVKLRKKALEQGLFTTDTPPTDQDVAQLIFASGMSTAEQVTTISGRGVGMDAVKRFLQRQQGDIEIVFQNQEPGSAEFRPIEFHITLPGEYGIQLS